MHKPKSLIQIIRLSMIGLSVLLIVAFGSLWIYEKVKETQGQYTTIRDEYIAEQKDAIKGQVDHAIAYIQQKKSLTDTQLRASVKSRTEEAYQTALYIYEHNRQSKPLAEIKQMVHDALYSASWDDGRGYYFALDMQGTGIINRNRPDHEGQNLINLKDDQGTLFMQDFIAMAKSQPGEGFCSYNWSKPESPDVHLRKISYVKYFAPFDWVIGNGKYLLDEEKEIQQEILQRVETIRYGTDGYIFIGRWDGLTLSGPSKGKNMIDITDAKGLKIVQELIAKAKAGGGFVNYVMPKLENKRMAPKISYAAAITDWQWYVGTGVYVDAIEKIILAKQQALTKSVKDFVVKSLLTLLFFFLFSAILVFYLSRKIKCNLDAFSSFFNQSADKAFPIVEEKIAFSEFHSLAIAANRMAAERHQAWLSLEESERRFHQVFDAAHIPLAITDRNDHIHLLNRKFIDLFGYSQEALPDMAHWWELTCPVDDSLEMLSLKWRDATADSLKSGKPLEEFSARVTCTDGSIRSIVMGSSLVGTWWLLSFQDLTEQEKAEEEKRLLEEKLAQAQKMKAIGLLAGGVAHDLNNILSGIVSYPELLLMQLTPDSPLRKHVEAIRESGKQAAEVVADLLTVARGIAATREIVNLNTLITDFFVSPEYLRIRSLYPGVHLISELEPTLLNISCSTIHIKKSIMNLVLNAAEAIDGSGTIIISTINCYVDRPIAQNQYLKMGEYVLLSVKDNGSGISENDLERIFEPFYTKKVMGKSGTGLGLSVVWSSVQDHGGAINVDSSDQGTVFTLYLPATRENVEQREQIADINELRGNGEQILVIDDEKQQREISSSYLTALDYKVGIVDSGEQALEYLKTHTVDLILLDMIMDPGMNGRQTYEHIINIHPGQKAVIASGFSETEEVKKTLALGASNFIKKPYTFQQIGKAILKALKN
ncbi:MAG: cache domain-containing protein, partial [Desulfocapsaceae bacterium]|nr:cache domain-containing protein [Desulfocapsaceae bacterium]